MAKLCGARLKQEDGCDHVCYKRPNHKVKRHRCRIVTGGGKECKKVWSKKNE